MKGAALILATLWLLAACSRGPAKDASTPTPPPSSAASLVGEAASATPTATAPPAPGPSATTRPAFDPGPVILPTVAIPTPTPTPVPDHPQATLLDNLARQTTIVRNLFAQKHIEREFITRKQLQDRFAALLEKDREDIAKDEALYRALGVLTPESDLYGLLLAMYGEGVLGFYDADQDKLFLVQDKPELRPGDHLTYVHEYAHALQQQYFDIRAKREELKSNHDRAAAFRALIEGDASVTEVVYMFNFLSDQERTEAAETAQNASSEAFDSAPHLVQRGFVFPYFEGYQFVGRLLQQTGDWNLVNQAYQDPPASTEQILHQQKYLDREPPVVVSLPDVARALGEGWTELRRNTLGELTLLAYLESKLFNERASLASTGWGGDSYSLLQGPEGQNVLVALITWDSGGDAQEFFDAFVEFTSLLMGGQWEMVDGNAKRLQLVQPGRSVLISIDSLDTLVLIAPDAATIQRVRTAIDQGA